MALQVSACMSDGQMYMDRGRMSTGGSSAVHRGHTPKAGMISRRGTLLRARPRTGQHGGRHTCRPPPTNGRPSVDAHVRVCDIDVHHRTARAGGSETRPYMGMEHEVV
jgi:hypothetical protein